jgi:Calcium-activated chloride channel.
MELIFLISENHRTQSQFDRYRITKLVLFEFVNNFMSLFYVAFYIQDLEMLRTVSQHISGSVKCRTVN